MSDKGERPAGIVVTATNTVNGAIYRATTGNLGPEGPTGAFFFDFPHGEYLVTADVPGYTVTQERMSVPRSGSALVEATP